MPAYGAAYTALHGGGAGVGASAGAQTYHLEMQAIAAGYAAYQQGDVAAAVDRYREGRAHALQLASTSIPDLGGFQDPEPGGYARAGNYQEVVDYLLGRTSLTPSGAHLAAGRRATHTTAFTRGGRTYYQVGGAPVLSPAAPSATLFWGGLLGGALLGGGVWGRALAGLAVGAAAGWIGSVLWGFEGDYVFGREDE